MIVEIAKLTSSKLLRNLKKVSYRPAKGRIKTIRSSVDDNVLNLFDPEYKSFISLSFSLNSDFILSVNLLTVELPWTKEKKFTI